MAGDDDRTALINQLQSFTRAQGREIKVLQEAAQEAGAYAVTRVWGVVLLAGLFATTMGTWLVVPVFNTSSDYSTLDTTRAYGFWDILGSPGESISGQTGITMALLIVLIGVGMAGLSVPGVARLRAAGVSAVLLLASEVWLRAGMSGQVAAEIENGLDDSDNPVIKNAYAYGGAALTLALGLTGLIAVLAFNQAQHLKRAQRRS
jgi:hypothetical protein